jgi:hypothetical protein
MEKGPNEPTEEQEYALAVDAAGPNTAGNTNTNSSNQNDASAYAAPADISAEKSDFHQQAAAMPMEMYLVLGKKQGHKCKYCRSTNQSMNE